ncbi:dermonecrotic toxin domain-containing protein [Pseudomonas sp. R1-6]|uniref:dermonecrotic toxin domain-containing protein n=1 Tax=Pseudomonas sp. R1-6 TaxID=2817397 RepID=UPI003DA9EF24
MTLLLNDEPGVPRQAPPVTLARIDPLPDGNAFEPHKFADQWLLELGLLGDTPLRVTYQEVEAVDSAAENKTASVPLRAAVTQGFLKAYQSEPIAAFAAFHRCEDWIEYPHRSHMKRDFSALRIDGFVLPRNLLQKLHAGVPPGYRGPGLAFEADSVSQDASLAPQEEARHKQLKRLATHKADLNRLFAGLPTFDTALKNLLVDSIRKKIEPDKFRGAARQAIDPDNCYVNHFTTDSLGARSLVSSLSFSEVMMDCLSTDESPVYAQGSVGFFTRSDTVQDTDSLFVDPMDARILAAMTSAFRIENPTTNNHLRRQFLDDLAAFRTKETLRDALDPVIPSTAQDELVLRLSQRFLYLLDLYKADRDPTARLTHGERNLRNDEDRLLSIITTHPSEAARGSLMRKEHLPHVYKVMLEMEGDLSQKWPAAMVIKQRDQPALFLYSMERGIERFDEFRELVNSVTPVYQGQERKIKSIDQALPEHVFERAAKDLLDLQYASLQAVLKAPELVQFDLARFALDAEKALELPMLALDGVLVARSETLLKNSRPDAYRAATIVHKRIYRILEEQALTAESEIAKRRVQTISEFSREKIVAYLREQLHKEIDPDPDRTLITLFQGRACTLNDSRLTSLTQLMIDNTRPAQYPNAMKEIRPVYLVDKDGQPISHPLTRLLILLTGPELARMATSLDIGDRYETYLKEKMNAPDYKEAWWDAYLANMSLKGYEAVLKGDDVLKETVTDVSVHPARTEKRVVLWQDAVIQSSKAKDRVRVQGREVHVYGLLLGGTVGAGGQHGTLGNATSVDGVLIFSDQDGPTIQGTVGVYFPDSPGGDDLHEFANLNDGVADLLQREEWQVYFASRIATNNPQELKQIFGTRSGRPLARGSLIGGDLSEALHGAHVRFRIAHADHRSNSNRNILHQTIFNLTVMAFETLLDVVSFLAPAYAALQLYLMVAKTGQIPLHLNIVKYLIRSGIAPRPIGGAMGTSRNRSFSREVLARLNQQEKPIGLPLEQAIYGPYAVKDATVIRGLTPDAGGFYRVTVRDAATGVVTARPVYVRQPGAMVLRVHDSTKLNAAEATLVDPVSGSSIRSSGVMRSTVARMPDGEWRAVGFGRGGGGERPTRQGPSGSRTGGQTLEDMISVLEQPGQWDFLLMDIVPELVPHIPGWPQNRGLVIMDVRPGRLPSTLRLSRQAGPERLSSSPDYATDVVVRRSSDNHYDLVQADRVITIRSPGDCFFSAVTQGLDELEGRVVFTPTELRLASAGYIRQNLESFRHLELQDTSRPMRQPAGQSEEAVAKAKQVLAKTEAALENLLGRETVEVLTSLIAGARNPYKLFGSPRLHLSLRAGLTAVGVSSSELWRQIEQLTPARPLYGLATSFTPYTPAERSVVEELLDMTLVSSVGGRTIDLLARDGYFQLNRDSIHILLEYGVDIDEWHKFYPKNPKAYIPSSEAAAGDVRGLLNGRELVHPHQLAEIANTLKVNRGEGSLINELIEFFRYKKMVGRTVGLLRGALRNRSRLLARAERVLVSRVIATNLGGALPVSVFSRWISHPSLGSAKLDFIARYADTRAQELLDTGNIDIRWIHLFTDKTLRNIEMHSGSLAAFIRFLEPASARDIGMASIAKLLSGSDGVPSNSRIVMLLDIPNLLANLTNNFTREEARSIWRELISPYYSDLNIYDALGQVRPLNSEANFTSALINALQQDVARAHQLIDRVFADPTTSAQVLNHLYRFDFTANRAEHSLLMFAEYVGCYNRIPDWAWQYKIYKE